MEGLVSQVSPAYIVPVGMFVAGVSPPEIYRQSGLKLGHDLDFSCGASALAARTVRVSVCLLGLTSRFP